MMKKTCLLLIAVLLLGCLAACQSTGTQAYGDELTQSQKAEIESHFQKQFGQEWGPWEDDGRSANNRYYGSDSGYAILFHGGNEFLGTDYQQVIGDCKFIMPSGQLFVLFAYKNGQFHLLNDVFEDGGISEDALRIALQKHTDYEK